MNKLLLLICASMFVSSNVFAGNEDPVVFADPEVESICIQNWDFNKDGKFTYAEAASVSTIGRAFAKNVDITKFNELQYFTSIKYLEEFAFEACPVLEEITLPSSMESLEKGCFCDCSSLSKVTLNDGLKYIGEGCFANCGGIETIDIPESVVEFGNSAFHKCMSLLSFKVPAKVEYLPIEMFNNCAALENVTLQEGLKGMANSVFNECYNLKSITLPSTFNSFGMWVFWDCYSIEKYDVSPDNPNFTSVNGILYSKDLKTLVQYPAGKTDKELSVPEGTEMLGFASCEGALNLEKVVIPSSVKMLDGASLYKCENLKEIKIEEGLEEIGNEVFYGCMYLTDPVLPQSLKKIGSGAFTGCESFEHMVLPENVTYIDFRLFYNCYGLTKVDYSKKVEVIDQEAFSGCVSLASITIPKTVEYIGPIAFNNCGMMNEIKVYNEKGFIAGAEISEILPTDENGAVMPNERIVYVPKGCKDVYEQSEFWSKAKEIREIDDTSVDAAVTEETVVNINGTDVKVNAGGGMIDIYTTDGTLVERYSVRDMKIEIPSGIYVVNGKKITVR